MKSEYHLILIDGARNHGEKNRQLQAASRDAVASAYPDSSAAAAKEADTVEEFEFADGSRLVRSGPDAFADGAWSAASA